MFHEWATAAVKESGLEQGTALAFVQGAGVRRTLSSEFSVFELWLVRGLQHLLPSSCSIPCLCHAHLQTDACAHRISALGLSCLPGLTSSLLSPPSVWVPPPPEALPACSWPWLAVPLPGSPLSSVPSRRWPLLAEALITDPAFLWAQRLLESRDMSSPGRHGPSSGHDSAPALKGYWVKNPISMVSLFLSTEAR